MTLEIGSRYAETKNELTRKIRAEEVLLKTIPAKNHFCYLCSKPIENKTVVVVERMLFENTPAQKSYFIGKNCYDKINKT